MYQQALLSWGNLQYEESQMVAVAGGDWRAILDDATAHFRQAGCNEADIRGALVSREISQVPAALGQDGHLVQLAYVT